MKGEITELLRQKLVDSLAISPPALTRREIILPKVPGKALAVIGMRRSGKTSFLWQCLGDRLASGDSRESLIYMNFEDDRLIEMDVSGLSFLVEEYFRLYPKQRSGGKTVFFFDEIQLVPQWETFVRRLMDTEKVDIFLSGSSASMLSQEVASSMRGRAMEVTVFPFSFRETLAHCGRLPDKGWAAQSKAERSALQNSFREYLEVGGFPEAQGLEIRDRNALLRSYVDVAVLRDVIERHSVSNPIALRWLQRHLLGSPAALFSIQKFYNALRSQGIPVAKDTLHSFLGYLDDAFLIRTLSLHTASERQRMVNQRKAYPIDMGFIPIYEQVGRANLGHALETAVLIELLRRGNEVHYVRTKEGYEVDFHVRDAAGSVFLIQVCADVSGSATFAREIRSLAAAASAYPDAKLLLLSLEDLPGEDMPVTIKWQGVIDWFLQE